MLFISERYKYNNNKISILKDFSFLSITSFIVTRLFKPIVKNELNENNFDINLLKDTLNKKRSTLIFKTFKEKMIKKSDFINITKINASIYYYLTHNKKNKLFSLTINEIYDILYEFPSSKTL